MYFASGDSRYSGTSTPPRALTDPYSLARYHHYVGGLLSTPPRVSPPLPLQRPPLLPSSPSRLSWYPTIDLAPVLPLTIPPPCLCGYVPHAAARVVHGTPTRWGPVCTSNVDSHCLCWFDLRECEKDLTPVQRRIVCGLPLDTAPCTACAGFLKDAGLRASFSGLTRPTARPLAAGDFYARIGRVSALRASARVLRKRTALFPRRQRSCFVDFVAGTRSLRFPMFVFY